MGARFGALALAEAWRSVGDAVRADGSDFDLDAMRVHPPSSTLSMANPCDGDPIRALARARRQDAQAGRFCLPAQGEGLSFCGRSQTLLASAWIRAAKGGGGGDGGG